MKNSSIVLIIAALGALLLIAGCSKAAEPKPVSFSGEAVSDSTAELDSGFQDVEELNQLDQEAQDDIGFEEFDDVDLS